MTEVKIKDLFTTDDELLKDFLDSFTYPWEALPFIKNKLYEIIEKNLNGYYFLMRGVLVHESADIDYRSVINAPCIISENVEVRPFAYLRGGVFLGKNSVVGNSTEVKNSILLSGVTVPHYNYVGDSILGKNAHFGAGVIASNLKSDKSEVYIKNNTVSMPTGLKKCGAFVGDNAEVGANTVLSPGSVIGKNASIYPLSHVRGVIDKGVIYKSKADVVNKY
ncbi:MAG: UDP-N-acetylglucosamine pyrophosphorylase [Clostridia bacterium]|nr:UDP-N-acetylglucosamine pyrophosphorylase [Clostridia bacterium]